MDNPIGSQETSLDRGVRHFWGFLQQYGFLVIFVVIAGLYAKSKYEEVQCKEAVKKLNNSDRSARLRAEMQRIREEQQRKAKEIVQQSVEAEKERKKQERETRRRALESVENYDPKKHDGFDVRRNPLMSGGHGKNFTRKPRFGRVKPGCGPGG
eukprot:CAMPEP_0195521208 /NCGR_PEP_ID=MMETSP0794_2-20130614/18212_1 /TAXON_ID=515487 /ORGANISM="Stephanopyxis turris, Strain CCMP 815" /LENGTH=153 /DNA_ID=CAMNT_0040650715 /DNA_START=82 /DNA_END=543 /DNA_ORIENTATION=+